jgi:hypothetical protein
MNGEFENLEKRIKRLERQNRLLGWSCFLLIVLGLVTAAGGQTAKDTVIRAQKIELHDDAGRLRADLSMVNGASTLRFFDGEGIVQSLVSGDQLSIYEKEGDILASFTKEGLEFGDGHQKTYVRISAREEDRLGKVQLNDYRTKTYAVLTAKDLAKLHQLDANSPKQPGAGTR